MCASRHTSSLHFLIGILFLYNPCANMSDIEFSYSLASSFEHSLPTVWVIVRCAVLTLFWLSFSLCFASCLTARRLHPLKVFNFNVNFFFFLWKVIKLEPFGYTRFWRIEFDWFFSFPLSLCVLICDWIPQNILCRSRFFWLLPIR